MNWCQDPSNPYLVTICWIAIRSDGTNKDNYWLKIEFWLYLQLFISSPILITSHFALRSFHSNFNKTTLDPISGLGKSHSGGEFRLKWSWGCFPLPQLSSEVLDPSVGLRGRWGAGEKRARGKVKGPTLVDTRNLGSLHSLYDQLLMIWQRSKHPIPLCSPSPFCLLAFSSLVISDFCIFLHLLS